MEKTSKFAVRGEGPQGRGDCYAELLVKGFLEASSPREGLPQADSLSSGLRQLPDVPEPGLRSGIKAGEQQSLSEIHFSSEALSSEEEDGEIQESKIKSLSKHLPPKKTITQIMNDKKKQTQLTLQW
uniref:Uncharacterized protein n=1 Tax=Sphaerodactylus townsendi TaxID=933632 RepID=A0ACB8GCW2_9SAUR